MNEWISLRFDELGDVVSGGTPSTSVAEFWDGDIAFVTPYDLSKVKTPYIHQTQRYITRKGVEQSSANILPANSLILSSRAPIGYLAISKIDFVTNQGCKSLRFFMDQDPLFHYYNLQMYIPDMQCLGVGTTFSEISKRDLSKLKIGILSSFSEQQRIAKILNTCDILIERTVETISKYQAIKQGKLQNLFTRGLDSNGKLRPTYLQAPELYKESELGIIPKEWIVSCFGDNSQTYAGGTPSRSREDYFGGYIPWISSSEVNQDYIEKTKEHITQEALDNSSAKRIPKNAILIALYGATAGQVSKLLIDASANQAVLACLGSSTLLENYIYYLLDFSKERLLFKAQGSGQPNLSKELVDKLKVVIPDKIEQEGIVKRLNSIDQKIKSEVNIMQKYKSIKQGLMNDLLTGKKYV